MGEETKQLEETKAEEKKEDKGDDPFVLFVDLHCVGCAKKIERTILKIRGVEGVSIDMSKNQVTIKGGAGVVEPQAVCNRIMKKTKRRAKVLSPLPEAEPMTQVVASQVNGLTTVELNVNMHCEACAQQLKKKLLNMKGVRNAETELSSGQVKVTGTMDAVRLADYVYRRTRKQAKNEPQAEPEPEPKKPAEEGPKPVEEKKEEKSATGDGGKPEEEKKEEGEKKEPRPATADPSGGGETAEDEAKSSVEEVAMYKMMYDYYQPIYVIERIPLFSDEDPNACSIM